MPTQPEDVAALAESVGAPVDPARYPALAAAIDAFAGFLGSLDQVAVEDGDDPPAVFDPRW